jgi:hypothetical protein
MSLDLTTFTEVDPNGHIAVTASRATGTNIQRNEYDYLYKDFGAGYFGTDFVHTFAIDFTNPSLSYASMSVWGLSNTLGDISSWADGIVLELFCEPVSGWSNHLRLVRISDDTRVYIPLVPNTVYYVKVTRTSNAVTVEVCSDSGMTTLVGSISLALSDSNTYRYFYSIASRYTAVSDSLSGYVENYEFFNIPNPNSQNLDLTTFTEVDPNNHITETASRGTFSGLTRNESAYLYEDFGAGYFGTDFIFDFNFRIGGYSGNGLMSLWGLSNEIGDVTSWTSGIWLNLYDDGGVTYIKISGVSSNIPVNESTVYYARIIRAGSTLTLLVFSDSGRTTLVGALSTYISDTDTYRYFYAISSRSADGLAYSISGYSENYVYTAITGGGGGGSAGISMSRLIGGV